MQGPTGSLRRSALVWIFLLLAGACHRPDSPATVYQRLWGLYVSGNLPKTIQAVSQESGRWNDRPNSVWSWKFRLLHAEALLGQGKAKDASALLHATLPATADLAQMAVRRDVDLADATLATDRDGANRLLDHAASIATDPDVRIRIRLLRGVARLSANEIDAAEAEFHAALIQAVASGNGYREAGALNNLSLCARRRADYERAIAFASQALDKAGRAHAGMVQAQAHGNLATYFLYLGNTGDASDHLQQAIAIFQAIDARVALMTASNLLGIVHDAHNDAAGAAASYERAYQIALELDRKSDAALYAANLSITLIKGREWSRAAVWNQKGTDLDAQAAGNPTAAYILRNRARLAVNAGELEAAAGACHALLEDAQKNQILRWEAYEMLAGMDTRARHFAKANQEFAAALATIDGARAVLENPQNRITLLSRLIPFHQEYVDSLVDQNDDAKALTVVESSRARVLGEALRRTAEPMVFAAASLKRLAETTRSTVISYWLAPTRSFAWLITPTRVRRFVLPPAADIEALIASYRNTIEHSWGDPLASNDANGARLWSVLVAPMAAAIPHGGRVIVIPDGALHRLNLETLPAPGERPHYWVEDVELVVAPSMTVVASRAPEAHAGAPSLLLMGAPMAVSGYEKLPQADAEISGIQSRFPTAAKAVFTGAAATVAAYRNSTPQRYSLIHFAAHAEPNPESPLESAIVLSPGQGAHLLKARDIVGSQLSADLVTISACRSAGTRVYAGEGLIGLAWAFLEAGSNAVIAGLWDVNDGSSRLLMEQLYGGIAAGAPPAVALHRAKLAMLQGDARFRKPYFWAPFQAYVRSVR